MRLPKYDILLPTLFVGVIFPAAAGGWWRYFSGYADQIASPVILSQPSSQVAERPESETGNRVLIAHVSVGTQRVSRRRASKVTAAPAVLTTPVLMPIIDEPLSDQSNVDDRPLNLE